MENLEQLHDKLELLKIELKAKQREIDTFDTSDYEHEYIDEYENMLDECYPECMGLSPSYILKNCRLLDYEMGLSEYVENLDKSNFEEYKDLEEELQEIETQIEEIETQIEEKESTND